jgi:hypothetical protein
VASDQCGRPNPWLENPVGILRQFVELVQAFVPRFFAREQLVDFLKLLNGLCVQGVLEEDVGLRDQILQQGLAIGCPC